MNRPSPSTNQVKLVGLDFGSTTSSALVASARIAANCATGRMEFASPEIVYRSQPVFTPFNGNRIELPGISALIDGWLMESGLKRDDVFAGGAIVTGLAARRENAHELASLIEDAIGEGVVATADDPRLESWLAFMGSVSGLSRVHPGRAILNFDIGGGTTNPAMGQNGNVRATGCYFIGARHLRFEPGTYTLVGMSGFGRAILAEHGIERSEGDELSNSEIEKVVAFFVNGLEAIATRNRSFFSSGAGNLIEQVPFDFEWGEKPVMTFSGGVGELVYSAGAGVAMPERTFYGDLGIDLAHGILNSQLLSRDLAAFVPEHKGRATVQGLTMHSTEVSGTTLFLPRPAMLPLRDLPVVASVTGRSDRAALAAALRLAGGSERGACLHLVWDDGTPPSLDQIRRFGADLSGALMDVPPNGAAPVVLLTTANAGKAIGNYATGWQREHRNLIVIDEIPVRHAQFVNLGRPRHGVVPVSFYGLTSMQGDNP